MIFDLDPQDGEFSAEKIMEMQQYFCESSDMGKLYLNYPMVEAFYHMSSIPDENYLQRRATLFELKSGSYKARVNLENRNRNYTKFAVDKSECNIVIRQNLEKGCILAERKSPDLDYILKKQLFTIEEYQELYVLCTCVYYIYDFNPNLILEL